MKRIYLAIFLIGFYLMLGNRATSAMPRTISSSELAATVQQLIELLAHPDLEVRRLALMSAARRPSHGLLTTLVPMLTLLGLWLPILVSGSAFVEAVFNWPGLGSLAAEAIAGRDYPVLLGTAMLVSGAVVVAGFLTDIGYMVVDPRVRPR